MNYAPAALVCLVLVAGCAGVASPELPGFAVGTYRLAVTDASPLLWSDLRVETIGECNVELERGDQTHRRPVFTSTFTVDEPVAVGDVLVVVDRHHDCRVEVHHGDVPVFAVQFTD